MAGVAVKRRVALATLVLLAACGHASGQGAVDNPLLTAPAPSSTVAIAPTIENAVSLAIIVLIRTVLSFSLETEIEGNKPPQSIQLDITGVKRLKFLVDYGQNLDTGDWLNLCEARIAK